MSNMVVTGAAGFIGSHLCEALLAADHEVIGLDNFDPFYDPQIKRNNIASFHKHPRFTLVEGDIRDVETVEHVVTDKTDVVIHLAAKAGVRPSIEQPLVYQDVNVHGTNVMLEVSRRRSVMKFILASSSSVYGNNEKVPFAESDPVDHPISPYAATKKACELLCHTYHHLYQMSVTCLRFFTVYGPRQRPDLAIHKFLRLMENDEPIPVFGDGSMMRDFTFIDDIIDGVMRSIDRCSGYNIYNLGESQPIALSDLIQTLQDVSGKKAIKQRQPLQPGDVNRTFADVTLARKELGYQPSTDIRTGLTKFVDWYRHEFQTTTPRGELVNTT